MSPRIFLSDWEINLYLGSNHWTKVPAIQMSLIYWEKLHAEQATWIQSNPGSFWMLCDKWAFLADDLLLLSDHLCVIIIEYIFFWHLWWILIEIDCPWLLLTPIVNSNSSSISPYIMIAGRPAWTLLNLLSLDDSGRLQITQTSADITTGWNLNLYYSFRESNYLNT